MKKVILVLSLMGCTQSFAASYVECVFKLTIPLDVPLSDDLAAIRLFDTFAVANNVDRSDYGLQSDDKYLMKLDNSYSKSLDQMLRISKAMEAKSPTQINFLGCIEQPLIK